MTQAFVNSKALVSPQINDKIQKSVTRYSCWKNY